MLVNVGLMSLRSFSLFNYAAAAAGPKQPGYLSQTSFVMMNRLYLRDEAADMCSWLTDTPSRSEKKDVLLRLFRHLLCPRSSRA